MAIFSEFMQIFKKYELNLFTFELDTVRDRGLFFILFTCKIGHLEWQKNWINANQVTTLLVCNHELHILLCITKRKQNNQTTRPKKCRKSFIYCIKASLSWVYIWNQFAEMHKAVHLSMPHTRRFEAIHTFTVILPKNIVERLNHACPFLSIHSIKLARIRCDRFSLYIHMRYNECTFPTIIN